jgi:hypothetical protein
MKTKQPDWKKYRKEFVCFDPHKMKIIYKIEKRSKKK